MSNFLEIYYYGDLNLKEELSLAILSASKETATIKFSEIDSEDTEARFNYLIPVREGLGGGEDFGIWEAFELILAFGTVQAFVIFAKAFLSKSGEIVAEKLFDRLDKSKREKIISEEKQKREKWSEYYQIEKTTDSQLPEYDWIEDKEKHDRDRFEWWQAWGEAGRNDLAYRADINLEIYVEEKDRSFEVRFEFNHDEEKFTDDYPFIRTPRERFRELVAKEALNFQKTLEQTPDGDHVKNIQWKKEIKKEMLKHLTVNFEKDESDSKE
jgi:hypothetical protein